jgi:pilus assembly protein CpaB
MQKTHRFRPAPRLFALLAALAFGAIAYAASREYLDGRERAAEQRVAERHRQTTVIVAREHLPAGTVLEPAMLATRQVPERYVAASAVRPDHLDLVVGQQLVHELRAGETLQRIAIAGAASTFSSGLESGRRALTFPVDEVNAISGMLAPGDVIDLLYTDVRSAPRASVRPLLQRVTVLATGTVTRPRVAQGAVRGQPGPGADDRLLQFATITLSVTPAEAQLIVLAQRSGELTAVLRHPADSEPVPPGAVTAAALAGAPPPKSPRPTAAPEYVEFVTGGQRGLAASTRVPVDVAEVPGAARSTTGASIDPPGRPDAGDVRARLGLRPRA